MWKWLRVLFCLKPKRRKDEDGAGLGAPGTSAPAELRNFAAGEGHSRETRLLQQNESKRSEDAESQVHSLAQHGLFSGTIPDQEVEMDPAERAKHERFMREALAQAEYALTHDETPVGCVFVHNGEIIGRGMNDTNRSLNGTRHAEFIGITQVLEQYDTNIFAETDLYVTVEPCIMCASALRQYGIRKVYFGCANDRFGGTGGVLNIHTDPSIDPPYPAIGGIFREEAIMLLRRFYIQENGKAPVPHKKNRVLKEDIPPLKPPKPTREASSQHSASLGHTSGAAAQPTHALPQKIVPAVPYIDFSKSRLTKTPVVAPSPPVTKVT